MVAVRVAEIACITFTVIVALFLYFGYKVHKQETQRAHDAAMRREAEARLGEAVLEIERPDNPDNK